MGIIASSTLNRKINDNIDYYTEEIQQADTRSDTFYCQEISSDGVVIDENTIYEIDNECLECFQYRH